MIPYSDFLERIYLPEHHRMITLAIVANKIDVRPGQVYGRLTVIADLGGSPRKVKCRCACGKIVDKALGNLRNKSVHRGHDTGCGCYRRELTIARNTTHGLSGTPEYSVWTGMRKRCLNPNCKSYADYGGRGIKICKRWESFAAFLEDMGPRPTSKHSIERNNPNGDYSKRNCKWATKSEQNRNTRVTRYIEINGVRKGVSEWDAHFAAIGKLKPGQFKCIFYRRGANEAIRRAGVAK